MGVLSIDQVRVFLAIVDRGSFSAAARSLRRNQSAVSYAVLNLEHQLGVELFDRGGKQRRLTPAGEALLPDARRAAGSLDTLRARAQSFARGAEAEIELSIDAFCPLEPVAQVLADFEAEFPMVRPWVHVNMVGTALRMMLEGRCALGLLVHPMSTHKDLEQFPTGFSLEMAPFAAPSHPLAGRQPLDSTELSHHVQLLMTEMSGLSLGQEFAVFSPRNWRCNDLRQQRAQLLAGIGWGFAPRHIVSDDLAARRLVELELAAWPNGGRANVPVMLVQKNESALGPAGAWLRDRLRLVGTGGGGE